MGEFRTDLAQRVLQPLFPALGGGAASGACGVAYGSVASILIQSPTPVAYTTLSGVQWLCAGTTYFYCRNVLLTTALSRDSRPQLILASGVAGSCAGAVGAAFLPRGAIVPGSIMLGIVAAVSQAGLSTMGEAPDVSKFRSKIGERMAGLIPMKSLSDNEYEELLRDKLVKVEAQIAVLDDQIADLRSADKMQQVPQAR